MKVVSKGQLDLIPEDPKTYTHTLKDETGILLGLFQLSRFLKHGCHKPTLILPVKAQKPLDAPARLPTGIDSSSLTSAALLSRCENAATVTS